MDSEEAKIFVAGLLREVEEDALLQHFKKYGPVLRAVVIREKITGNSRGYGFVWFSDPSSAKKALDDNELTILGKKVIVKRPKLRTNQHSILHQPLPELQFYGFDGNGYSGTNGTHFSSTKIFVGGLPANLTKDEFKKFFERFGEITDVVIMQDSVTRRPRGFGFITYESENSVEVVMQRNYYNLNGRYVEVKRAVPRSTSEHTNCFHCYSNGHVGTGSESSQGPRGYFPYYPAYGNFPHYGFFPGYSRAGAVPYLMRNYWGLYPVTAGNPSYGPAPVYTNGFVRGSGMVVQNQNGSEMAGGHDEVERFNNDGIEAQMGTMKIEDNSPRIGDLKLNGDSLDGKGGRDASSC